MSQLVKTKRQANFKGFKGFGVFKGLVEQKNVVFNSFHSRFKIAHACQKRPYLHTNSSNKLLHIRRPHELQKKITNLFCVQPYAK
jgi:hypothetical protein